LMSQASCYLFFNLCIHHTLIEHRLQRAACESIPLGHHRSPRNNAIPSSSLSSTTDLSKTAKPRAYVLSPCHRHTDTATCANSSGSSPPSHLLPRICRTRASTNPAHVQIGRDGQDIHRNSIKSSSMPLLAFGNSATQSKYTRHIMTLPTALTRREMVGDLATSVIYI
jgi:hypothetical protein